MSQAKAFMVCLPLAIFVLMARPLQAHDLTSCGTGWVRLSTKCYKGISGTLATWPDAKVFCNAVGGHLAIPENAREVSFLRNLAMTQDLQHPWIGVIDINSEGRWVSSVSHERIQYSDWGDGQPNDNRVEIENCVGLREMDGYGWHDYACGYQHHFICERRLG